MFAPAPWAEKQLRQGAENEQRRLRWITDDTPVACTALLADVLGDTSALRQQVTQTREHGVAPGYFNSYLAALLSAENAGRLSEPLLLDVVDARYPPLAAQDPRSWALSHPIALSTALLWTSTPVSEEEQRIAAAFAAQKALFDAYMGENELAMASLAQVLHLARTQRDALDRDRTGHVFIIGAAAAILARELGTAETLLDALHVGDDRGVSLQARLALRRAGKDDGQLLSLAGQERWLKGSVLWRVASKRDPEELAATMRATPITSLHGVFPYIARLGDNESTLRPWLEESFPALCENCGLRSLAEHVASRRMAAIALAHPMALRLAEPARNIHAAMLRRDIAVPLYLLERVVEANREADSQ
jgi:hypothetical protein